MDNYIFQIIHREKKYPINNKYIFSNDKLPTTI